ncbi:site-specific integrase [Candidatus Amesbacteria bacterium]|nr:site-specific integrase [Candidatus Amesbacteria bacterium]
MTISTPQLLSNFSAYLTAQQLSSVTVKNYSSDIRYFLNWIRSALPDLLPLPLNHQITPQTLNYFHQHLSSNQPLKTANRRLSSIRKFCQFLKDQNYTALNSATHLSNIPHHQHPNTKILQVIDLEPTNRHLPTPIQSFASFCKRTSCETQSIIIIPVIVFIVTLIILLLLNPLKG